MTPIKSTVLHVMEFVFVLVMAYVITKIFNLTSQDSQIIVGAVISGFIKFARSNPDIPLEDYVNKK